MDQENVNAPAPDPDLKKMVIVIGAMKCATSSLHHYLHLHPNISMPQHKELNFFIQERNWNKGLKWYKSRFNLSKEVQGESSPNYTKYQLFPGVPQRMHAVLPHATLVYIMRDPVDRIVSHYVHNVDKGRERRSFEEALDDLNNNNYILTSSYFAQLSKFLEYYPKEQLLLFDIKDMKVSPDEVIRKILAHEDIHTEFAHKNLVKQHHKSSRKRRPNNITRALEKLPMGGIWRHMFPSLLTTPIEQPMVTPQMRQRILGQLRPDIKQLEAYWGRDLSAWKE